MNETIRFDLLGPLPGRGTHVLEASAGTGKTYTIAGLVARHVADGIPLTDLLMVTFSRAATRELSDRIRERLATTEQALRDTLAQQSDRPDDGQKAEPLTAFLTSGDPETLAVRLERISNALAGFDSAAITTTHEFCSRMLAELGVLSTIDPASQLVENINDLVREVASDLWLRAFAVGGDTAFGWAEAHEIAKSAAEFDGPFAPPPHPERGTDRRVSFARVVRQEVRVRKAALGIHTYDDLLTRLQALLEGRSSPDVEEVDEVLAEAVRRRLRERFSVVLIDEFQDTDPVQWQIVRDAFAGHSSLVLIGDPKQAIYGFRGADVYSYLAASEERGAKRYTLDVNRRSDDSLIRALDGLMGGAALGDPRITVRRVEAHHRRRRLQVPDPDLAAPMRLRVLPPAHGGTPTRRRRTIIGDLVSDVGALLGSGATVQLDDRARPLAPSDLAVVVRTNSMASDIRDALTAAKIQAVQLGATSVYASEEAGEWLTFLEACSAPQSRTIRRAALTSFIGWTLADLVSADDEALNELSSRFRRWSRILADQGVAALVEACLATGLGSRLLSQHGGDRRLTDILHIGQSLHGVRARDRVGSAALIEWLAERIAQEGSRSTDLSRRLENDADAVQIMTVHRSKGLQFPVVYLPDQWEEWARQDKDKKPFAFHHRDQRVLYVGGESRDRAEAWKTKESQEQGESLRNLYVAATRAQCQVVAWWAPDKRNTPRGPLHRLMGRDAWGGLSGCEPAPTYPWDRSPTEHPHLKEAGIAVTQAGSRATAGAPPPTDPPPALHARAFDRHLDTTWRRTSYSGLTAAAHEQALQRLREADDEGALEYRPTPVLDDEVAAEGDERETATDGTGAFTGAMAATSPMAELPRGASFGTLVHAVYEGFDPQAADLLAEVTAHAEWWLARLPVTNSGGTSFDAATLAEALLPSIRTPLGPIADNLRLCDIPVSDRLAELDFEYPLAGDLATGIPPSTLAQVGELLQKHLAPDDPLVDYYTDLADPTISGEVLRGYLTGSIDAVLRIRGESGPRFVVVDYKTNWLGPADADPPLQVGHYTAEWMSRAMAEAHYPLQALLYCVALHRYLRWRLPGYRPETHLGGVAYLFVRGMAGPQTPSTAGMPCGVFSWKPAPALILDLSDLLAGIGERP